MVVRTVSFRPLPVKPLGFAGGSGVGQERKGTVEEDARF